MDSLLKTIYELYDGDEREQVLSLFISEEGKCMWCGAEITDKPCCGEGVR